MVGVNGGGTPDGKCPDVYVILEDDQIRLWFRCQLPFEHAGKCKYTEPRNNWTGDGRGFSLSWTKKEVKVNA